MKLSPNFTLKEMVATSYPSLQGEPTVAQVVNLVYLCASVLQPLRDMYGRPIIINSGWRSESLNRYIGGVANSYHLTGLAADIQIKSEAQAYELFTLLKKIPQVDLCLFERAKSGVKWLHVQTTMQRPRHQFNYNYIL